jgi:hypothetical protein
MELYFTYRGIYVCSIYKKHRPDCYERTRDLGTLGSIATWL